VVLTELKKAARSTKRSAREGSRRDGNGPGGDLDGWDSAVKVAALAIALMGAPVRLEQVQRTGIRDLSEEKIRSVARPGCVTNSFAARNAAATASCAQCSRKCCSLLTRLRISKAPVRRSGLTSMCSAFDCRAHPGIEATAYGLLGGFYPGRQQ